MVKLFLDTEFTGLQQNATLISIALVADSGAEFYAEFTDYDPKHISEWLKDNVMNKLFVTNGRDFEKMPNSIYMKGNSEAIRESLQKWIAQFPMVEIWADVLAWDWVLFCNLFGGAFNIPENIFYAPFDLATVFRIKKMINPVSKYNEDVKRFDFVGATNAQQHNALIDARVEMACFKKIMDE